MGRQHQMSTAERDLYIATEEAWNDQGYWEMEKALAEKEVKALAGRSDPRYEKAVARACAARREYAVACVEFESAKRKLTLYRQSLPSYHPHTCVCDACVRDRWVRRLGNGVLPYEARSFSEIEERHAGAWED